MGFLCKKIGDIINDRRVEFALTQAELSELSKVGINTLTHIERGEGNPTIKNVEKVLTVKGTAASSWKADGSEWTVVVPKGCKARIVDPWSGKVYRKGSGTWKLRGESRQEITF